jgi:hypothetical protein
MFNRAVRHPRAPLSATLGIAAAVLVAACGGSASPSASAVPSTAPTSASPVVPASPMNSATPVPATPTAAASSAAPASVDPSQDVPSSVPGSIDPTANGGFAFKASDVMDYYKSVGFTCADPTASTQAKGYQVHRCTSTDSAKQLTTIVGIVVDATGMTGDAFAGVLDANSKDMPANADASTPLLTFMGAMLGETAGTQAGIWLASHMGEKQAQTTVGDMVVATYTENDANGVGVFGEVANKTFMDAPVP